MSAKERPILFSAPMVRAILEGRKTQTRRVMARQKQHHFTDYTLFGQHGHPDDEAERSGGWAQPWVAIEHAADWPDGKEDQCRCPYAERRGDRLWVREAWRLGEDLGAGWEPWMAGGNDRFVIYGADGVESYIDIPDNYGPPKSAMEVHNDEGTDEHWRSFGPIPSIYMPRWACRILLEVTDVRVERLQAISEDDASAEGVWAGQVFPPASMSDRQLLHWKPEVGTTTAREAFGSLWNSINGPAGWDANPWVWAITFRRLEPRA